MAEQPTVDLVAAVLTREATRTRGDAASPYSWGTTLRLAPGHARDTAVAVLTALRAAGRLVTAGRLAEFGRMGWAVGFLFGALIGQCAERYEWPGWAAGAAGAVSFAGGLWLVGRVARRVAGRDGGRRG